VHRWDVVVEPLASNETVGPWIDVSVPIRSGMLHWPGNPPIVIEQTEDLRRGDDATVSSISIGSHTGTHVDAPVHFLVDGTGVDRIGLERLLGPARVIDVGRVERIEAKDIETAGIAAHDRVLFKSRNSQHWGETGFRSDYTCLSTKAARWLVERGVWTVGIDYLSIGCMDSGIETHRALLGAGICIIEGLDLSRVGPGIYDLICLPLRIEGLDGAPARVVLRERRLG
jgi:arylformamidase